MLYSVVSGEQRTVEISPPNGEPPFSMGTRTFIEYVNDAIFEHTYTIGEFLNTYRFAGYGERHIDISREAEFYAL